MLIWSKPSDKDYHGPAIYRLIVNGQNYCGKTFEFHHRMTCHKSHAKCWREHLKKGKHVQTVSKTIDDNWDDVVIEIIARYPDKNKDNEEDKLFMNEREIEAIALYDSFHNGLNMNKGGISPPCLLGKYNALGSTRTAEQKQAISQRMTGKKRGRAYNKPKSVHATKDDKTWNFSSSLQATQQLAIQFKENFDQSSISKACRGKYGTMKNKSVYKGIHFIYD